CSSHPSTTQIYTLSLHDALPIFGRCTESEPASHISFAAFRMPRSFFSVRLSSCLPQNVAPRSRQIRKAWSKEITTSSNPWNSERDRKSTRLNSSHVAISYAVFCL